MRALTRDQRALYPSLKGKRVLITGGMGIGTGMIGHIRRAATSRSSASPMSRSRRRWSPTLRAWGVAGLNMST